MNSDPELDNASCKEAIPRVVISSSAEVPGEYHFHDGWVEVEAAIALSRYPVADRQVDRFIQDSGYRNNEPWSAEGWESLQRAQVSAPRFCHDCRYDAPN
jgi:hypothetical protein